jgi:hypothetical protein
VKTTLALATLLLTATLAAQGTHVFPVAPTTATPIEVHYLSSCVARSHSVVRQGNEITITAIDPQCPAVLPIQIVEKVKLAEALPIGVYDVSIVQEHEPFFLTGTRFVVRNGGPKPFELHPSTLYGGTPVRMSGVTCEKADCSGVTVRVGVEPVAITVADDGAIWFTAPDLEQGLADVTVQQSDVVVTSPGALYYDYADRNLGSHEPILIPIVATANGAFGSRWESVATVSNPSPWPVDAIYTLHNIGPCIGPCDPAFEPKFFRQFSHGYPHGTVMWVPRPEAADLALSLRIRDASRQEQSWGTEVPVVREHDLIHGETIRLLDVPLDPRYRVKVRIYMVEPFLTPSRNGVVRFRRGDQLVILPFTFLEAERGLRIVPHYAEVDLPQGAVGERVNVEIALPLDATGWAFASVTNNETQQVTIAAPN